MGSSPIALSPSSHRFFHQLATVQAATAAYILGHMIHAGGNMLPFTASNSISQVCNTRPKNLNLMRAKFWGRFPNRRGRPYIHLKFHAGTGRAPANQNPSAVQHLMASFYEHAFITYFEKNVADIKAKHGNQKDLAE